MTHFVWRWLAASSLLLALMAGAETRPQYGGTLRSTTRVVLSSLDPADDSQPDSFTRRNLTRLIFDTLTTIDENGRVQPALAESWQSAANGQRWQFRLRRGVKFHDGSALTADVAAASLRAANPAWRVSAAGDAVVIEAEGGWNLPAEVSLPRNAITKRSADSQPSGTGPFHIADWQPGRKLSLAAEEGCWRGRPFLDGIEIEMGRSLRDQITALDLGKADLIEVAPEQTRRAWPEGRQVLSSAPVELVGLVFARDAASPEDKSLRRTLAFSVERGSIRSVLLQGAGQPTAAILPTWLSGYGFVFPTEADLTRARNARAQVRTNPTWSLGYDGGDPLARLLADRIALNARDAGLALQPTTATTADVRLVRIALAPGDPWIALIRVAALTGMPTANSKEHSVEDLYAAEQAVLATQRMIPLFHLPVSYASGAQLRQWAVRPDGTWNLDSAWLVNAKP